MHPAALVWTGVAAHKTKTVESDDLCRNPRWSGAVVNLAHINPTEALSIEIVQHQDVFYDKTVARFMADLSELESCVETDLWLEAIGGYMTAEQERTYRKAKELFDGIDKDGNGLLDKSEVKTLFESMNLEVTDEQHDKAYREMDDDGNGEVDFDEFHEWYANHQHSIEKIWKPRVSAVFTIQDALDGVEPWIAVDLQLPAWAVPKRPQSAKKMTVEEEREEALGLFKEIDLDDSGALDAAEIKHLLQAMGVKLSDKDVTDAIKAMGNAGKHEVDFESFFLWWQATQSRAAGMRSKLMNKMKLRLRNVQSPAGSKPSTALQAVSSPPAKSSEEVKQFFETIDTNGNGLLDREEVRELSRSLGAELTKGQLTEAMDSMDPQNCGVDFEQFFQWYTKLDHNLNSAGSFAIRRGFRSFASKSPSSSASQPKAKSPSRAPMDPAVKLRLETARVETQQAAAAEKQQPTQSSSSTFQQIEAELGLTGSPEEAARIAKMQASVRGKQDRKKVEGLVIDKELKRARTKFDQMDKDGNGRLDGEEMHALALWVFESFHPGGQPLPAEEQEKEAAKLRNRLDADGDGKLDFDEFAAWFTRTCQSISKYRKGLAQKAAAEKQRAQQIEAELGLTGSPEEAARIAKMQASVRGKQDRKKVASMKATASSELELGLATPAESKRLASEELQLAFSSLTPVEVAAAVEEVSEHLPMGWELHYPEG